jgi:coproporphyrinogen III oxidase
VTHNDFDEACDYQGCSDEAQQQRPLVEKGGVNWSSISGDKLPDSSSAALKIEPCAYRVTGLSLVIHPKSPHIPTIHMNVRYFEAGDDADTVKWWFGGGVDLTPNYIHDVQHDVRGFHDTCRRVCEQFDISYVQLKQACDRYFYLPHRNETRGVGGLFYDHLNSNTTPHSKHHLLMFSGALANAFIALYRPYLTAYRSLAYTPAQRDYLLHRRSRYVEFNLLFDRGTKFGIQSQGRTESILMSMPATAKWSYNWLPEEGTVEHEFVTTYLKPTDWLGVETTADGVGSTVAV